MTFHPGEREIQHRAGVQSMADKVGRIIQDSIPEAAADFLERQRMLVLGYRDEAGRVRASLVTGRPGFARVTDPRTLRIAAPGIPDGEAAVLAIDFEHRQRMRLNGRLENDAGGVVIRAKEVYSNCPKYIQRRVVTGDSDGISKRTTGKSLSPAQRDLLVRADTFFIATVPPGLSADVSHRGGNPGFVRVPDATHLEWDDFQGNAMFNTLGNLVQDPEAGLLFVDFEGGRMLNLNGRARVVGDQERRVVLEIREVSEEPDGNPLRWELPDTSPFNPR
ncbi:MAG TPA: pyridoxamine 5'-phosphate oxidase family protein [Planctomycetota bacterium]|nr:pyridoxamine 5'-phosphate oxidase family protein [Planctomycetota bacterium]